MDGLKKELAEISGISLRTIQRIETNASKPRPYTLKTLADNLKISTQDQIFKI